MKKTIIFIVIMFSFVIACANIGGEKATTTTNSRPSPLSINVTKGNLDIPVQIQVTNRTKRILTYLEVELTFEDTLGDAKCKIAVDVISDDWVMQGNLERVKLRDNGTNLYRIDVSELEVSDCWAQFVESWPNVAVTGRITDKEFTEPDDW